MQYCRSKYWNGERGGGGGAPHHVAPAVEVQHAVRIDLRPKSQRARASVRAGLGGAGGARRRGRARDRAQEVHVGKALGLDDGNLERPDARRCLLRRRDRLADLVNLLLRDAARARGAGCDRGLTRARRGGEGRVSAAARGACSCTEEGAGGGREEQGDK